MTADRRLALASVLAVAGLFVPERAALQGQARPRAIQPDSSRRLAVHVDLVQTGRAFGSVGNAVRLGQTLVTYDEVSRALVYTDRAGRELARLVAAKGTGAARFTRIGWLGVCSDGLVFAFDPGLQRVLVFDGNGHFLRFFRAPPMTMRWACSIGGTIAVLQVPQLKPYRGWTREYGFASLLLLDAQGNKTAEILHQPVGQGLWGAAQSSIAVSATRVYLGTGDTAAVRVFDLSGRQEGTLSVGELERRSMRASEYEVIVRRLLGRAWPDSVVRLFLDAPRPALHPLYRELHATATGVLWMTVSSASDSNTTLRATSATGRVIGEVRIPHVLKVFDVGEDYIIAGIADQGVHRMVVQYSVKARP